MNATVTYQLVSHFPQFQPATAKERFRDKFQRSLRACVRRGFSVEESFGMIWVETWEEVALSEREQSELFDELIDWAKKCSK